MNITILSSIFPSAKLSKLDAYLPHINACMKEFDINTNLRQSAFIAQIGHETCQFNFLTELWGPTPAQKKYEGRKDLGNIHEGDGKRYKGRGAIQLTGRTNYIKYGKLLNLDLENNPELAALPENAFRIAGQFWKDHGLNELADKSDFETITRRINGGLNGFVERLEFYNKAKRLLV